MTGENIPNFSWEEHYYKLMDGREPRQLLLDVLEKFPKDKTFHAIDLGCGDGTETAALLSRGWSVLAIDAEEAGIKRLVNKVPEESRSRLQTQIAVFEEIILPPTDLVHASYSLPFCHPSHFPAMWEKIKNAVKLGGRIAVNFFGVNDSWANETDKTFHTEEQVRAMVADLEIEYFHEMDEDGEATIGPKHWHVFTVIGRKV
ncbi:MAG TPA: class I SAM-dependent methyltransferase [Anaerolineales bacterium]